MLSSFYLGKKNQTYIIGWYLRFVFIFVPGITKFNIFRSEQQFHSFHQPGRVRQPAVPESAAPPEQPADVHLDVASAGIAVADRAGPELQPVDRSAGPKHAAQVAEPAGAFAGAQSAEQRAARVVRRAREDRVADAQPQPDRRARGPRFQGCAHVVAPGLGEQPHRRRVQCLAGPSHQTQDARPVAQLPEEFDL